MQFLTISGREFQVYYSAKIRIAKTGSSGSRGFKINTSSTATGTPLVERHEVANIELHQAMHTFEKEN